MNSPNAGTIARLCGCRQQNRVPGPTFRPGPLKVSIHRCDPTTAGRGDFCLLCFHPEPFRPSLADLFGLGSPEPSMWTPSLVRTPDQHRQPTMGNPNLRTSLEPASQTQDYRNPPRLPATDLRSVLAFHALSFFANHLPLTPGKIWACCEAKMHRARLDIAKRSLLSTLARHWAAGERRAEKPLFGRRAGDAMLLPQPARLVAMAKPSPRFRSRPASGSSGRRSQLTLSRAR